MEVALVLHFDHLEVIFSNTSTKELRLWELWNSWGYWSIAFQLRNEQDANVSTIMRRWNTEFTRNGPTYFVVAPGEKRGFPIDLNDGWWMRDHTISRLKDKPLFMRISYTANPVGADFLKFLTRSDIPDEVNRYNERLASELSTVFAGSVVSDWVVSEPPHNWLFAQVSNNDEPAAWLSQYPRDEVLKRLFYGIDNHIWSLEQDAKKIYADPTAASTAMAGMSAGTTVGHLVNGILEYAEEIHKKVGEAYKYLESTATSKTGDLTDTNSQD